MKHLSHRTIAIIVALLSTLSLALAVISLPHQAYAVDGTDGTSGTNSTSQGSDGDSAPIAGPVPNIIVTNFTYGGDSVAAGADFNLDFTFQNMGQVAVTNMVITVDGGESFAIAGGTNTFYVDALWGGYAMTQSVPMQALASAKSGAQPVTVNFRYEYVDASARSSSQSDVKISVPISQPDRFEISDPVVPDQVIAGQENTVTMEYVNKGKGDIANVEATMEGRRFRCHDENPVRGQCGFRRHRHDWLRLYAARVRRAEDHAQSHVRGFRRADQNQGIPARHTRNRYAAGG